MSNNYIKVFTFTFYLKSFIKKKPIIDILFIIVKNKIIKFFYFN